MFFGIITIMIFTFLVGYTQSFILTELGVSPLLIIIIGFAIGLYLPRVLIKWIYKEEIEQLKSQSDEE